jgi:hypothetical protein
MGIAEALESMEAAMILQQLHYWMEKEGVGVKVNQKKYIYNSFKEWVSQQFRWLTEWKFRQGMKRLRLLGIVEVIRYRASEWNQTNYYTLNYERLREWAKAESIEIIELWNSTDRDVNNQTLEMRKNKLSINETKITTKKETTKNNIERSPYTKSNQSAAAQQKTVLKKDLNQKQSNNHSVQLNPSLAQNKPGLEDSQEVTRGEKKDGASSINVRKKFNKKWEAQVNELDDLGVGINKTIINLVKMYSEEEVRRAIALLKVRKREKQIPNMAGYFTAAVKGGWSSQRAIDNQDPNSVSSPEVFRLWYDLSKELGYCSSCEVRDGQQWVLISGSWEKWEDVVNRGYTLEYLKKVRKRSQR